MTTRSKKLSECQARSGGIRTPVHPVRLGVRLQAAWRRRHAQTAVFPARFQVLLAAYAHLSPSAGAVAFVGAMLRPGLHGHAGKVGYHQKLFDLHIRRIPLVLPILLSLAFALSVCAVATFGWTSIVDRVLGTPERIRVRAARLRKLMSERLHAATRRRGAAEQTEMG